MVARSFTIQSPSICNYFLIVKNSIECTFFQDITVKSTELENFDAIFRGDCGPLLTKLTLDVISLTYREKVRGRIE